MHGVVRAAADGGAIAGAVVEVDAANRTTTDSAGRYTLALTGAGEHQFRFIEIGYLPRAVTVAVADSTDLALDVELTSDHVLLPPLAVVAGAAGAGADGTGQRAPGEYRLGAGWQSDQLAGDIDVDRAIARVPGIASRGIGPAVSIRGGFGSQNAVLLDGTPLFGAVHFASAASSVNPDAVHDITVYTGVQPARFGDALGGVIELNTGEEVPAAPQWTGDLSAVDARTVFRAPLGRGAGIMVGARASFRDLLTDGAGFGARNGYQDVVATTDLPLAGGSLHALAFAGTNRLRWAPFASADGGQSDDPVSADGSNIAQWSSGATSLRWRKASGPDRSWIATAWWSGTRADLGVTGAAATDALNSGLSEFGASVERRDFATTHTTVLGAQLVRPRTWYAVSTQTAGVADPAPGLARFAEPAFATAYGEWNWNALRAFDLAAGLRATTDFGSDAWLDPRLTLNLHPDAATRISAGYGRNHQPLQSMLNEENVLSLVVAPALLIAPAKGAPAASSEEWQAGITRRLSRRTTLSLDGYTRTWNDVLTPAVNTSGYFVTTTPVYGSGHASGIVASSQTVRGPFTIDLSAGLATATQRAGGTTYRIGTGEPWTVSGDISFRPNLGTAVQMRWLAGAGQFATPLAGGLEWRPYQPATGSGELEGSANLLGPLNGNQLPSALRIDVGVRHTVPLHGRSSLNVAIQFENLLNRADPVGVAAAPDGTLRLLRGIPRGVVLDFGWAF
ncbi:MAG: TonB-dependent receptor [Gemmatimonadales bacterium]